MNSSKLQLVVCPEGDEFFPACESKREDKAWGSVAEPQVQAEYEFKPV